MNFEIGKVYRDKTEKNTLCLVTTQGLEAPGGHARRRRFIRVLLLSTGTTWSAMGRVEGEEVLFWEKDARAMLENIS